MSRSLQGYAFERIIVEDGNVHIDASTSKYRLILNEAARKLECHSDLSTIQT